MCWKRFGGELLFWLISWLVVCYSTTSCPNDGQSDWEYSSVRLPTPRAFMASAWLNSTDTVYLLGGNESQRTWKGQTSAFSSTVLAYDESKDSMRVAFSNVSREFQFNVIGQCSFARDSVIYVLGAWMPFSGHSSAFSVSPLTWRFTLRPELDAPCHLLDASSSDCFGLQSACVWFDGGRQLVFVSGGLVDNGGDYETWPTSAATAVYNWSAATWRRLADLRSARYGHSCALLSDSGEFLYALGGAQRTVSNDSDDNTESLPSIERLCVSDACLHAATGQWQQSNQLLQPARVWAQAKAVVCPYKQCQDASDELICVTGGYQIKAHSVLNFVSSFKDLGNNDAQIVDDSCMRLKKSGHSLVYHRASNKLLTFGGLSDEWYYLDQIEQLAVGSLFSEKQSGGGRHTPAVTVVVVCGIAGVLLAVACVCGWYLRRVNADLKQSLAIQRKRAEAAKSERRRLRKRQKEMRAALIAASPLLEAATGQALDGESRMYVPPLAALRPAIADLPKEGVCDSLPLTDSDSDEDMYGAGDEHVSDALMDAVLSPANDDQHYFVKLRPAKEAVAVAAKSDGKTKSVSFSKGSEGVLAGHCVTISEVFDATTLAPKSDGKPPAAFSPHGVVALAVADDSDNSSDFYKPDSS